MMSLGDAAQIEMSLAIPAIIIFTALGFLAAFWEKKWASLLALPILLYPWVYVLDLALWLRYAGHNLDPTAAITIDPFTPVLWGTGEIAQFSTNAGFTTGWYLAVAAGISCVVGIFLAIRRNGK